MYTGERTNHWLLSLCSLTYTRYWRCFWTSSLHTDGFLCDKIAELWSFSRGNLSSCWLGCLSQQLLQLLRPLINLLGGRSRHAALRMMHEKNTAAQVRARMRDTRARHCLLLILLSALLSLLLSSYWYLSWVHLSSHRSCVLLHILISPSHLTFTSPTGFKESFPVCLSLRYSFISCSFPSTLLQLSTEGLVAVNQPELSDEHLCSDLNICGHSVGDVLLLKVYDPISIVIYQG